MDRHLSEVFKYFEEKRKQCLIQKLSYEKWLGIITPLRWISIVLGVILPAFVGFSIFIDTGLISKDHWKIICTLVLLISSIISGLHTALKWDIHHQECIRLSKQY